MAKNIVCAILLVAAFAVFFLSELKRRLKQMAEEGYEKALSDTIFKEVATIFSALLTCLCLGKKERMALVMALLMIAVIANYVVVTWEDKKDIPLRKKFILTALRQSLAQFWVTTLAICAGYAFFL